jgi:hypothetical protein
MSDSQVRRNFRGKEVILDLLHQQEQSGLTVKAFCQARSLPEGNFRKWKNRYLTNESDSRPVGFARVEVSNSPSFLFAEVIGIRIFQPVSAAYLKELLS